MPYVWLVEFIMDFSALMSAASGNTDNKKLSTVYSTKLPPVKKLPKARVNKDAVSAILKQKEKDKKRQDKEDKERLKINLPKVKKKKSGFTLDDLASNSQNEAKKSVDLQGKNSVTSEKKGKKTDCVMQNNEGKLTKDSDDRKCEMKSKSIPKEETDDDKGEKKEQQKKKRPPPKPLLDFASILSLAKDNLSNNVNSSIITVEELLAAKEKQKNDRPLTQRQLEEENRRKRRELEERHMMRKEKIKVEDSKKQDDKKMNSSKHNRSYDKTIKEKPVKHVTQSVPSGSSGTSNKAVTVTGRNRVEMSTMVNEYVPKRTSLTSKDQETGKNALSNVKKKTCTTKESPASCDHSNRHCQEKIEHKTKSEYQAIARNKDYLQQKHRFLELERGLSKRRDVGHEGIGKQQLESIKSKYDRYFKDDNYDGDSDDEYDDDMDDFIDDGDDDDGGQGHSGVSAQVSQEIRQMFGRKRRYESYSDDSDDCMEASYNDILKEEARSSKLGKQEDLEDMRKEEEYKRNKLLKKKLKKKR